MSGHTRISHWMGRHTSHVIDLHANAFAKPAWPSFIAQQMIDVLMHLVRVCSLSVYSSLSAMAPSILAATAAVPLAILLQQLLSMYLKLDALAWFC